MDVNWEEYRKLLEEADQVGESMTMSRWKDLAGRAEKILGERKDLLEALAVYYPGQLTPVD